MTLYEIGKQYQEILSIDESDPDMLAAKKQALDEINESLEIKADNIARFIRNLDADITALKAEEERLAEKRKTLQNKQAWLKEYLFNTLKALNLQSVKAGIFTVAIRKNPPSVAVKDQTLIPQEFFIPVEPKLDLRAIAEKLKAGERVPGAELTQGESLAIR